MLTNKLKVCMYIYYRPVPNYKVVEADDFLCFRYYIFR